MERKFSVCSAASELRKEHFQFITYGCFFLHSSRRPEAQYNTVCAVAQADLYVLGPPAQSAHNNPRRFEENYKTAGAGSLSSCLICGKLLVFIYIKSYHLNINSNMDKGNLKKELKDKNAITACAREFNMVGDPTRLKICYLLCRHKELSVGDIAEVVSVSISAVSHTLKKLQKAGLVENRREFRTVYYKLKKSPIVEVMKERMNHYENV
jgi:ArsR family transcriptional regulator